jgi:hypothetical protein
VAERPAPATVAGVRVRPPRLALAAAARQEVEALVERALAERPAVDARLNASG